MYNLYLLGFCSVLICSTGIIFCCNGQSLSLKESEKAGSAIPAKQVKYYEGSNSNKSYRVNDAMRCALLDNDGILWFGTNHEGVYRYDGKTFTNFSKLDGLCHNQVNSIREDPAGNLWFGTPDGLCRYDKKTFANISIPWADTSSLWLDKVYPVVNPNEVRSLIQDKKGDFWLGTNGDGAYHYDGKKFTSFLKKKGRKQIDSLYHNIISSVLEDRAGNVWFTSMTHGGISRFDGTVFLHFTQENGLSDDMITCSFQDRQGNIWFGSLGNREGGLHKYDGKTFTNYNEKDGLSNNNIWCIYEDKLGQLWLGSNRGELSIYNGKTFRPFISKAGQSFDRINFIIEDATGNIWFGGNYGQLFRYDGDVVTHFTQKGKNLKKE